jgi:hypothetical protein
LGQFGANDAGDGECALGDQGLHVLHGDREVVAVLQDREDQRVAVDAAKLGVSLVKGQPDA